MTSQLIKWCHNEVTTHQMTSQHSQLHHSTSNDVTTQPMTSQKSQWSHNSINDNTVQSMTSQLPQWHHSHFNDVTSASMTSQLPQLCHPSMYSLRHSLTVLLTDLHSQAQQMTSQWLHCILMHNNDITMTSLHSLLTDLHSYAQQWPHNDSIAYQSPFSAYWSAFLCTTMTS